MLAGLIAIEAALSVVLLAGAGLLIRSFVNLLEVSPGFRAEHVLTLQIPSESTSMAQRNDPGQTQRMMQYFERIVEKVRAVPGVDSAGLVTTSARTGAHQHAYLYRRSTGAQARRGFACGLSRGQPKILPHDGNSVASGADLYR